MYKVKYSPKALEDLQHIYEYVSSNLGENVTKKVLSRITTDIRRLELYPMLGVNLGQKIDIPTEYRYIFVGKSYVFYRIDGDNILIIRVLNEKQSYMQILFGISIESQGDFDE